MPFPFLPGGAILATAVLIGALTIFGLALMALERAAGRAGAALRGSVLPGIVVGLQGWAPPSGSPESSGSVNAVSPATRSETGIEILDLD